MVESLPPTPPIDTAPCLGLINTETTLASPRINLHNLVGGRLSHFLPEWERVTNYKFILGDGY